MTDAQFIETEAAKIGFSDCRIVRIEPLTDEMEPLRRWLHDGMQASMSYMERNLDKRANPASLMDGAKTMVIATVNYYPAMRQAAVLPQIAKYAYGRDYHLVVKSMLRRLLTAISERLSGVRGRVFVDSAPVLEKTWAARCGLGYIGKNTLLINPRLGSFYFLGELIIDAEIDTSESENTLDRSNDICGACTRCIDACPTCAIVAPRVLDARRCISYLNKEAPLTVSQASLHGWLFGCDICQDVCPHNRKATATTIADFAPNQRMLAMDAADWRRLSQAEYSTVVADTPLKTIGLTKISENLGNLG